jgi:hypothetical protein
MQVGPDKKWHTAGMTTDKEKLKYQCLEKHLGATVVKKLMTNCLS